MKRVAIFLRNNGPLNRFRRVILGSLRLSIVDEALICSGFFQDDGKYSAGADFDVMSHRVGAPLQLTTLGLYCYSWKAQYATFFSRLQAANSYCGFSALQKRIPRMGWHAKVFLAKQKGRPLVGVIGSSNVTRRAFAELSDFNYECDVVIWDESVPAVDKAMSAAIAGIPEVSDVIVTDYDDNHPANARPLHERLLALEKEILAKAVNA